MKTSNNTINIITNSKKQIFKVYSIDLNLVIQRINFLNTNC